MSLEQPGHGPLDYVAVTYPGSMAEFRGPPVDFETLDIVCIGGSETFGRFVPHPFPQLLGVALGRKVANFGVMNAGLDLFLHDAAIGTAMNAARAVVLQISGAHMMTNRFYRVHPRRNDRFLRASPALATVYRDTDFTEFHFVRHMLAVLADTSPDRFRLVVQEVQAAWLARMKMLIARLDVPVHLLWIGAHAPGNAAVAAHLDTGTDPLFVTAPMIEELRPDVASVCLCPADAIELEHPTAGMFFGPREVTAARVLPGPSQHDRAATLLAEAFGGA
ncbi:hypothetical protein HKCCE3408_10570 [Rhodobacterales bacterium HKCCE3408]|nr:hypothetical protein [Rhodobacterales bacterium HKCCE3408]